MSDLNLGMFKAYDIRTKIQNLSGENKERLCNAITCYYKNTLKVDSVVICRDARLYVPEIAQMLSEKMTYAGIDVLLNPIPVSTCQFYYTCMQNRTAGGLMITASHNPGEYVGIKLMAPQVLSLAFGYGPEGGIEKIKSLYIDKSEPERAKESGKVILINETNAYIDYCMKIAGVKEGSLSGLKICFEFLNGSAGLEMAQAFQKAGADIVCRNVIPNGFFPVGDPNPIIESSIAPARKFMKENNFDFGFCFDGDGDRIDLMDGNGEQIVPGLNMSIIIPYMLDIYDGKKKEFYADVKAIPVSLCQIAKSGVNVHIIRNGHSFIKAKLRENCESGYFASEEESAHYYANLPYDPDDLSKGYAAVESTLFYALLTARSYKANPEKYKEAVKIQNSIFRKREWPLYCEKAPEKMPEILDAVERKMKELGAVVIKDMDDGSDLDAVLMRFNLPERFDTNTDISKTTWAQVAQRISRSEDAMVRWEVVSNNEKECEKLNSAVVEIAQKYVDAGYARFE